MTTNMISSRHSSSMGNPTIFDLLNLRTRYEHTVSYRKSFDLPSYNSDIDSLKYFIEYGSKNNRFRRRFAEAMEIAQAIVKGYDNAKTNLSSVHGKEE